MPAGLRVEADGRLAEAEDLVALLLGRARWCVAVALGVGSADAEASALVPDGTPLAAVLIFGTP